MKRCGVLLSVAGTLAKGAGSETSLPVIDRKREPSGWNKDSEHKRNKGLTRPAALNSVPCQSLLTLPLSESLPSLLKRKKANLCLYGWNESY